MIAQMSRVELVCLSSIREALVESLQAKGLLHLDEVSIEEEETQGFLQRVELEGDELTRLTALEDADRTVAEAVPLISIAPSAFDMQASAKRFEGESVDAISAAVAPKAQSVRDVVRRRAELQDQIDVLENYQRILQDVAPALGSDTKLGAGTKAIVLTGNVAQAAAKLDERLNDVFGSDAKFHKNQTSRKHLVGLIVFPEARADEVNRILNQEGIAPVDMRNDDYADASVGDVLKRVEKTINDNRTELGSLEGELNKVSRDVGADLVAAQGVIRDALAQLRVTNQFAASQMLTVIQGWTPADQYAALEAQVEKDYPGQVEINQVDFDVHSPRSIPTQLRNNKFFKPFETVMRLFDPPTYGTVDPTWFVGLSFVVFYGFILGDAVYGAVICGLAFWMKSKWGKNPIVADVAQIALYMGISSIVWGVIYGEYLGNFVELTVWPQLFGHKLHPLFHRSHHLNELLVYAIYFGIFHIFTALIMGVKEDFRHGHTTHGFEKLGMTLALLGVVIYSCGFMGQSPFNEPAFTYLAAGFGVVGVGFIFYAMRLMGIIGVIEVISLSGNIVSYARLMALGVASIALADIANDLPNMMPLWIAIPGALFIHIANIGIGIASPTIHSLRLNFVEFLPKFYAAKGIGYTPFRKEAQW